MAGMDDNFSFGYWLKRQRLARDLRQDDLAAQLGIATVSLRKLEADERRPSLQVITRVAEVFALSAAERETLQQVARADLSPAALPLPARAPDADPPASTGHTPDLPTGTVTFLFTDIEASTQRWEQHPALMRANLAQHDALLRATIAQHGGVVVKGTGDGLIAAFAQAADGLAAALESQRALLAADWGAAGPLRVRMALHSGEAQLVDGDYFGPTLNRTARLLAAGHGGQLLLSLAAAELLRDRLPAGVQLRDLGAHQLKDLARAEQIVQAVVADLPSDFPPLRTRDTRLRLLPTPPNPLIGREAELTQIAALLGDPTVRLLTLLGPGGTGKTRLSIQAAHELGDHFADGVCFVDLTPVHDPALVLPTIGRTLGIQESQGRPLADTVTAFLRTKALLLVLDNCEQVVDAASNIAVLLSAAPQLRVLATSRAALRIAAEQVYLVPPLAVPAAGDDGLSAPAAQLFLTRARAGRGALALTGAAGAAVAAICRRLDGLPLALELAAARLRHLTPQALLARLERPLALLTSGARDLPTRQQTLRATIAWSYDLLSAPEQALFRRLGVFVGGWDLAAAEGVGDLGVDTLDLLSELIDKSLIGQTVGAGDEPRYTMLETIREYALEQLEASVDVQGARVRHTDYFLKLAEAAELPLRGASQGRWMDRLEAELDNLRAALTWSIESRTGEVGLRLVGALAHFWVLGEYHDEGFQWCIRALSRSTPLEPGAVRAKALWALAMVSRDPLRSLPELQESVSIYRKLGDQHGLALALHTLGFAMLYLQQIDDARTYFEESVAIARALRSPWELGVTLHGLAAVIRRSDPAAARPLVEESIAYLRTAGDQRSVLGAIWLLGMIAIAEEEWLQAQTHFNTCLKLAREINDTFGVHDALLNLGDVAQYQGDYTRAAALYRDSLMPMVNSASQEWVAFRLLGIAGVMAALGHMVQAVHLLSAADALLTSINLSMATWPDTQIANERSMTSARAALNTDDFAAAWAAGRALSVEAATAEALAWLAATHKQLSSANAPDAHQAEE